MILDLSFTAFFKRLNVPIKFVLITLSELFFDASTAASAQQSIIKSTLGKFIKYLKFEISNLKFLIFFSF